MRRACRAARRNSCNSWGRVSALPFASTDCRSCDASSPASRSRPFAVAVQTPGLPAVRRRHSLRMNPAYRRYTRTELGSLGLGRTALRAAVRSGSWLRARRDVYLPADTPLPLARAAAVGGRLDCVSLLRLQGVFVAERHSLHVQFERDASRLPSRHGVVAHWRTSDAPRHDLVCGIVEALAQACRCQPARYAVATLDSAWHQGLVTESEIAEVFDRLPQRYRRIRSLLDPRCESGTETLVRLMLRSLGASFVIQAQLPGVGRVDFVVDGWLVVGCDSVAFHADERTQRRDRERDLAAALSGYTTLRLLAEDILYRPDRVREALRSVLAHGRRRR